MKKKKSINNFPPKIVNLLWKCQIFQYCEPEIKVRRLDMQGSDSLFGYSSVKYTYHKAANGDLERTTHNMTGVRVIFNTEGIGFRLSVENIIFQIANLVALLFLPKILADFILIYVLRYEDYASYKYENTLNLAKNQDDSEIGNEEIPSVIEKQEEEKKEEEEDDVSLLKDIDSD